MRFDIWEPVYEAILEDMNYDRDEDETARDLLAVLIDDGPTVDPRTLGIDGATVAVVGPGPSLSEDLSTLREPDVILAASTAAAAVREAGLTVDCVVTDLDGTPETALAIAQEGRPVALHAHGDNQAELHELVPRFPTTQLIPTTQTEPTGVVHNFGGFTDGDRAAFLADHFGAGSLVFPGWDFDDPTVSDDKARKLRWAERLLFWLEHRREEHFSVLDGRRESIETAALPISQ